MKILKVIGILVLVLLQLFSWLDFVPYAEADPWYDLARKFYYTVYMPLGIIGLVTSIFLIRQKKIIRGIKALTWVLLIISLCTVFPPLFKIVRYVFYPFVN